MKVTRLGRGLPDTVVDRGRANRCALVLDVDSFADAPNPETTRLRENQLWMVEVPPRMSVADAWASLDDLNQAA